jgi:predicted metal-dependent phosphoesterase TrpH
MLYRLHSRVMRECYKNFMKCDLHVHSHSSGAFSSPIIGAFCRESYSDPEEVYQTLRKRAMDLVTLTDHDSIDGCEMLRRHKNFFVSEEVTCRMPSGTEAHIGVYDITERQHIEIQRRRRDLTSLLIYLTENRLFFSINHAFSSLTGRREADDFRWFRDYFPAMETRNAGICAAANRQAVRFAARTKKIAIGGSDAHTLASVGTAFTEVPGARTKEEFLEGIRQGYARSRGETGNLTKLTRDVLTVAGEMMREEKWTALLAPLTLLIPACMLGYSISEQLFAQRWAARVMPPASPRRAWPFAIPATAAKEAA